MDDFESARQQMVEQQLRAWEVFDTRVLCAFDEMQREAFVPDAFRRVAFADTAIPLGHGEAMMAPKVEGRVLQALAVQPTDRVLEVGTGSGWFTALLATLGGEVVSFDVVEAFVADARRKLQAAGIGNATVECRDASALDDAVGRFDVIALTGSLPCYDARFEALLKPGGRLFVVSGDAPAMAAELVTRDAAGACARESLFETDLKPLRGFPRPSRFAL